MNSNSPRGLKYICDPLELTQFFSEGEVVKQEIEFVSVLTDIDFNPKSRCLFQFSNFKPGESLSPDYTCKITCNNVETLSLTKLTLSLVSQQFDLDFPDLDDAEGFCMEDIHLEKLCFVCCKGTFVTCDSKGGIFLQGLRIIDVHTSLFDTTKRDERSPINRTVCVIFDNLVKLNDNSKAQFKFVKLQNYDTAMRKYVQSRQESMLSLKEKNPLFGLLKPRINHDSQNDFDSQLPDPDSNLDNAEIYGHCVPNGSLDSRTRSIGPNDAIEESQNSSLARSFGGPVTIPSTENHMSSQRFSSPISRASPAGEREDIRSGRDYGTRAIDSNKRSAIVSSDEESQDESSLDDDILEFSLSARSAEKDVSLEALEGNQLTSKRQKIQSLGDMTQKDPNSYMFRASLDESLVISGMVLGLRINDASSSPSIALYIDTDASYNKSSSANLCLYKNCTEVLAYTSDNITLNSRLLTAKNSVEMLEELRWGVEEKEVELKVKKSSIFLADGYFTFAWTLISMKTASDVPQAILSQTSHTPRSSQVVGSSQEASQDSLDPLKTFSEISVSGNEVEFMRTFALLVGAKPFGSKMHKFVFTDFTSHPKNKLSAFDSFLGAYTNRLRQDMAFPLVIYNDHFREFTSQIQRHTGYEFNQLFSGNDNNLSNRGIVCRLLLKVKLYAGGIDGIVRRCEPVIATKRLQVDEETHLAEFYDRAIRVIPQIVLLNNFESYKTFFPIAMFRGLVVLDTNGAQNQHRAPSASQPTEGALQPLPQRPPPNLHIELEHLTINRHMEIPVLYGLDMTDSSHLYELRAKVVAAIRTSELLAFYITNDYISQDMLDPTRVLRVEIPGHSNMDYFFGTYASQETHRDLVARDAQLGTMIGETFTFRLVAFAVPVSPSRFLRIWCPVECTIQELSYEQAARRAQATAKVKLEDS
ncbi:LAQU0S05e04720g1_1 [Lachancea quebecensis]|uniref:LAQU0S05e04720g1_1 n=1 Tax=Lachancea quebecensis TaxID=1654605 RepID=A0A0P1KS93_9SACH|nr:LAQU0S05e04720g1_1 [Lachancea quebecensis]